MDETGFIHNQKSHKVVLLKISIKVCSKCADMNFYMNFVVCADKSVAHPLLIIPVKRLNRDVIESCNIKGTNV